MSALRFFLTASFLLLQRYAVCSEPSETHATSVSRVTDCRELQHALRQHSVSRIVVAGNLECTRENWKVPVFVQRNLEITGDPLESELTSPSQRPSINWTDTSHVLIVERAAVSVHDMVIYQAELGVGGLTLAFIHTRQGAAAVFAGVVVVVGSCSQQIRSYDRLISQIPRPVFLAGEQKTTTIGSDVLLVQDVAIWWPNLNSVWQLCNGIIVCVDDYDGPIPIDEYFGSNLVENSCAIDNDSSETDSQVTAPVLSVREPDFEDATTNANLQDSAGGQRTNVSSTIIVVAIVVACVVLITAILSYKLLCGRPLIIKNSSVSRRDLESFGVDTGSQRDAMSSRHFPNRNDMDLDLFERGANVPLKDVVIGSLLGRGGFGKVYKGTWKGTAVAIKVIVHGERLLHNELNLPFEAYLSRHISHPNVVQTFLIHTRQKGSPHGITVDTLDLFRSESPPSTKKSGSVQSMDLFSNMGPNTATAGADGGELFQTWLVLEFCDRASLSKAARKGELTNPMTEQPMFDHILLSALDVANAMNYLHSLGITHGDLKAENVLLKSASTDRRGFFCKVSDFGLSRYVGDEDNLQTFTYGTITHMPPELLRDGVFSTSVDVYSFGVMLWELLANASPYPEKNAGHILRAVVDEGRRPLITDDYPTDYADLIRDCWKQNPDDRPKFSAIVRRLKGMLAALELNNAMLRTAENAVHDVARHNEPGSSPAGPRRRPIHFSSDTILASSQTAAAAVTYRDSPSTGRSSTVQNTVRGSSFSIDTCPSPSQTSTSEFSSFEDA